MPDAAAFFSALDLFFPGALREGVFVKDSFSVLSQQGFSPQNAIACVSVCRDELTASLVGTIQNTWGEAFNFSSLAGMLFLGKTGFKAAHSHAPVFDQKERYIYYAMPHIAISAEGVVGVCNRPGLPAPSNACGALIGFQNDLAAGRIDTNLQMDDLEQSLIKRKLADRFESRQESDLVSITRAAYQVIFEDLEHMIELTVDVQKSDYAVITGILIHGPQNNYIFPGAAYSVIDGVRQNIDFK